ncbi:hypothetical protein H8356DRAFT_1338338 [Neocallimastix lanati (nom. inval.)]|nr:hypothetical protein H8356DRAFT_1338338 [Neocallimastix sp. JGI-2020a]
MMSILYPANEYLSIKGIQKRFNQRYGINYSFTFSPTLKIRFITYNYCNRNIYIEAPKILKIEQGFCEFKQAENNSKEIICIIDIYVDDILLTEHIKMYFNIKDKGDVDFNSELRKGTCDETLYRSEIGNLIFLAVCTRLDIIFCCQQSSKKKQESLTLEDYSVIISYVTINIDNKAAIYKLSEFNKANQLRVSPLHRYEIIQDFFNLAKGLTSSMESPTLMSIKEFMEVSSPGRFIYNPNANNLTNIKKAKIVTNIIKNNYKVKGHSTRDLYKILDPESATNYNDNFDFENIKQELYEKQISIIVKKTIILVKDYMIPYISNAFLNGIYVSQDRLLYSNSTTKIILIGYRVIIDADDYISKLLSKILEIWHRRQGHHYYLENINKYLSLHQIKSS